MGKSASTPSAPTLGGDIRDVISALPMLAQGSAAYNPLFSSLNMNQLNDVLFGSAESTAPNTAPAAQSGWYDASGNLLGTDPGQYGKNGAPGGNRSSRGGAGTLGSILFPQGDTNTPGGTPGGSNIPAGVRWIGKGGTVTSGTTTVPGAPGLISQWGNANAGVQSAARSNNPEMYALLDKLTSSANSDVALGNKLSPEQLRLAQQSSRAGAAARGMGMGPADLLNETFTATGYGDELANQRKSWAAQILGLDKSFADTNSGQAMNLLGAGTTLSSSNPINGLLGLAHDNSMTAYNASASAGIANANNAAATAGAGIGAAGMIGGALLL